MAKGALSVGASAAALTSVPRNGAGAEQALRGVLGISEALISGPVVEVRCVRNGFVPRLSVIRIGSSWALLFQVRGGISIGTSQKETARGLL